GSDRDLDRLAEIAAGKEVEDFMVHRFNLYEHYDIDSTDKKGRHKVRERFRSLYDAQKNKNDAIEVLIEDQDPQLAADMANAARDKINAIGQRMTKESQGKLLLAFESNIKRKTAELSMLGDSLQQIQADFGIYNVGVQGDHISEQLATSESEIVRNRAVLEILEKDPNIPRDTITYIKANLSAAEHQRRQLMSKDTTSENMTLIRFNEGMPRISILQDLHYQARKQLSYDLERYNQILATYNTDIPALLVVESAEVPPVKSRPKRSLIVLGVLMAAFLFTVLAALIADTYRDVPWRQIISNDEF
ncbi:MAG: hypothetical protein ACKVU2_11595, partial [Saprospiraceae bacterium]